MSYTLIQESRRMLDQLRQDAQQRAAQEAISAASSQIAAQTALLFEGGLAPRAEVSTTPSDTSNWQDLISDLLADNPDEVLPHGTTTTTTIDIDVPDEQLAPGFGAPATNSLADAPTQEPALEPVVELEPAPEDEQVPTVNTPFNDLTGADPHELVAQVLDAPEDQEFELVSDSPTTEIPMQDLNQPAPENTDGSFADLLRETFGDVDAQPATGATDRSFEQILRETFEGAEPSEEEGNDFMAELVPEVDVVAEPGVEVPEGEPADVDELAAALAALMAPKEDEQLVDEPLVALDEEDEMQEPEDDEAEPNTALNESTWAALQEEFTILNEGVMVLAAKNKNQETEIQALKEQLARKSGQLDTVKGFLNEAITMTAKTALVNQLLVENTTSRAEKKLIMESISATASRQEAEGVAAGLKERLQKNSLLSEQNSAQRQVERVFSSETGLLQESAHQAQGLEATNPMVARWAANTFYKSK